MQDPVREIASQIAELTPQKEQLEKDVNRINHDYELALKDKEYAERSLKYFEDNKEYIVSKYASEEIGKKLLWDSPYDRKTLEVKSQPIYEINVSELKLEKSEDPMEFYR